jgi:hypothetical protein
MATKQKTFDCVEMKNRIQADLMAQYEARKAEFSSFEEFVSTLAEQDPWVRKMRRRVRAAKGLVESGRGHR